MKKVIMFALITAFTLSSFANAAIKPAAKSIKKKDKVKIAVIVKSKNVREVVCNSESAPAIMFNCPGGTSILIGHFINTTCINTASGNVTYTSSEFHASGQRCGNIFDEVVSTIGD